MAVSQDGIVPFECDVFYADDLAVVAVRGEVDLATAPTLLRDALASLALPISGVRVDLRGCTFLDSSGVQALVTTLRTAQELGITFTLASVPEPVRRLLDVTGLAEAFGVTTPNGQDPPLAV